MPPPDCYPQGLDMPPQPYKKEKQEGWYRQRTYPHFDRPLSFERAKDYVTNPTKVEYHEFFPLLAYDIKARRYRDHDDRRTKSRPIKYAAHLDGYIYSYYCLLLSELYEHRIRQLSLDESVIAYRSGRGLSNIDFAHQAFEEIRRRGKCVAIALDISGFFDSIDHQKLEEEWCKTLSVTKLPKDHLSVFRSVTKWAEVNREECYKRLAIEDEKKAPRPLCKNAREFREKIKGKGTVQTTLLTVNNHHYGVPQGTPISALLSNVYMVPFDQVMKELESKIGGYYRRYSDDILWICDPQYKEQVMQAVDTALEDRGDHLKRKEEKTDISFFDTTKGRLEADKPLQYLGFIFDGRKHLLRSPTLARYWRRLIYAVRSAKRQARKAKRSGKNPQVFKKKLNSDLTHLGKGNFVTAYAYKAQKKMGGKDIRRQLAGHQERINLEICNK